MPWARGFFISEAIPPRGKAPYTLLCRHPFPAVKRELPVYTFHRKRLFTGNGCCRKQARLRPAFVRSRSPVPSFGMHRRAAALRFPFRRRRHVRRRGAAESRFRYRFPAVKRSFTGNRCDRMKAGNAPLSREGRKAPFPPRVASKGRSPSIFDPQAATCASPRSG